VEERKRAENEEVEPHEGKRKKGRGAGVLGGFGEAEGGGDSEDEEVNGDQKSGDDTACAEEEPQERLDAKFGWLSVHIAICPFVRWNPSGYVEFLVETHPASKKQIPHPAKSAGIRDDGRVEMWEVNKVK
jgi:hypothetical protein